MITLRLKETSVPYIDTDKIVKTDKKSVAKKGAAGAVAGNHDANTDTSVTTIVTPPPASGPVGDAVVEALCAVADLDPATGLPLFEGKPVTVLREDWLFYTAPDVLGCKHERIRNYLLIQDTFRLAVAMGRPLEKADMELLVHIDGEPVLCAATKKPFQPMVWALITKEMIEKLAAGKTLQELDEAGEIHFVGHFFYRKGEILAYSGTPYRFKKGYDEDILAHNTPLVMAYKANGYRWPMTGEQAEIMHSKHEQKKEGLVSLQQMIAGQIGAARRK